MPDDKTLIKRLQQKDEQALSLLYDKYSGAIYSVILKMTRDEGVSQDLLQDTFMSVWNKSYQYDADKGRFYTWLYRIAKHKVLNYLRKPHNLIQTNDLSVHDIKDEVDEIGPEFLELNGAVSQLEKHHQEAIELVYFKGLTHREAHEVMGVPLGTFKSYVRQALKHLREKYSKTLTTVLLIIDVL